jgi:hypothetical protein
MHWNLQAQCSRTDITNNSLTQAAYPKLTPIKVYAYLQYMLLSDPILECLDVVSCSRTHCRSSKQLYYPPLPVSLRSPSTTLLVTPWCGGYLGKNSRLKRVMVCLVFCERATSEFANCRSMFLVSPDRPAPSARLSNLEAER